MSDLAESSALSLSSPQLPVSWYFDPAIYDLELKHLFKYGPGYAGHQLMVPGSGRLSCAGSVRRRKNAGEQRIRSIETAVQRLPSPPGHDAAAGAASCQSTAISSARSIAGPTTASGTLLGAPEFPGNPCLNLNRTGLQTWQGLLFAGESRCERRSGRHAGCARAGFFRLHARSGGGHALRLQLEDLHRGVSGGLPRRARVIPVSGISSPATI